MKKFFSYMFAVVTLGLGVSSNQVFAAANDNYYGAGPICQAANLAQASKLSWNHERIYNPGPQSLWVVCPLHHDVASDGTTIGFVNTYFHPSASSSMATIRCLWRRMVWNVPGVSQAFTDLTATKPSGGGGSAINYSASSTLTGSGGQHWTVTCLLAPGTGIASIGVNL